MEDGNVQFPPMHGGPRVGGNETQGPAGGGAQHTQNTTYHDASDCFMDPAAGDDIGFENLEPIVSLGDLPMQDGSSPSVYATASDSSLEAENGGGAWRMSVPEFLAAVEDLEELLAAEVVIPRNQVAMTEMAGEFQEPNQMPDEEENVMALIPWQPTQELQAVDPIATSHCMQIELLEGRGGSHVMESMNMDRVGLHANPTLVLELPVTREGQYMYEATRGKAPMEESRRSDFSQKRAAEGEFYYIAIPNQGTLENIIKGDGDPNSQIRSQFEEVVSRVEEALGNLPSSVGNKKLRRSSTWRLRKSGTLRRASNRRRKWKVCYSLMGRRWPGQLRQFGEQWGGREEEEV